MFSSVAGLSPELRNFLASQPQLPALPLEALDDDCDLAANFTTAENEMASAVADAQNGVSLVQTCRDQVRQTYCDVIAAIEAATITGPGDEGFPLPGASVGGAYGESDDFPPTCDVFLKRVLTLAPHLRDVIALNVASCDATHTQILSELGAIPAEMTESMRDDKLGLADLLLAQAELWLTRAQEKLLEIQAVQAEMTLAAVQSSCLDCPGQLHFLPSNAIFLGADAGVLQVLAGAFEAAAAATSEPDDAIRFQAIADQMLATPVARVLHLSYPTGSAVGNHFVALRSDDDGFSPLAVVLSARAGGPGVNTMDQRILLDSLHALHDALNPDTEGRDDEDDDDDRVRDIHETLTGDFLSRTNTGTHPARPDTDGDLYFDGTEIATGSNPNDPTSVPKRAMVPVPALTLWGTALLGVLLAASALVVRRRSRRRASAGR